MNELLAIILIVLLCCFLFFAWLFALATCPDRMVNLISGTKQNSSSPISRASEDLAAAMEDGIEKGDGGQEIRQPPRKKTSISLLPILGHKKSAAQQKKGGGGAAPLLVRSRSIPSNRSNGFLAAQLCAEKRANSKKLSVVPEADEQLTVTSITQCLRPSQQSKSPAKIVEGEEKAAMAEEEEKCNGDGEEGKGDPLLAVKTVLLNRHPSDCSSSTNEQNEEKKDGEKLDDKANADEQKAEAKEEVVEEEEDEEEKVLLARRSAPPGVQLI